jgi:hypothetical protein
MMHDCRKESKEGDLLYICSRCGGCYVCKHKAIWFSEQEKWMWKCKNGKFVEVILDRSNRYE